MTPERASGFIPARVWDEKVHGRRALASEARMTWWGLRRWLGGEASPVVDPVVADRLRVAQMALDVAGLLKFNGRPANDAILRHVATLLDCEHPSGSTDTAIEP